MSRGDLSAIKDIALPSLLDEVERATKERGTAADVCFERLAHWVISVAIDRMGCV